MIPVERLSARQKRWGIAAAVLIVSLLVIVIDLVTGQPLATDRLFVLGTMIVVAVTYLCWPFISRYNRVAGAVLLVIGLGLVLGGQRLEFGVRPQRVLLGGAFLILYGGTLFVRPELLERLSGDAS